MNKIILKSGPQEFIHKYWNTDILSLLLKNPIFEGVSQQELVEQLEAKKKCQKKLPTWFTTLGIYYPNKLNKKHEKSPIFLQFLDCCYQLMMQFSNEFEFTKDLLFEFVKYFQSGQFGDFFYNCMREREEEKLWLKTPSFFKYLHELWYKEGKFDNVNYYNTNEMLEPMCTVRNMVFWNEVYCCYDEYDKDIYHDDGCPLKEDI